MGWKHPQTAALFLRFHSLDIGKETNYCYPLEASIIRTIRTATASATVYRSMVLAAVVGEVPYYSTELASTRRPCMPRWVCQRPYAKLSSTPLHDNTAIGFTR
jgi:hypothetical protein